MSGVNTTSHRSLAIRVAGEAVRAWDPYGLLASGCPREEFDSEIAAVAAEIPRIRSARDATLALSRVFSSAFEPKGFTPDDCAAVGAKLFAALSANGLIR